MAIIGIKKNTKSEGAHRTWGLEWVEICKDVIILLLFLSEIHKIKMVGFIMENEYLWSGLRLP